MDCEKFESTLMDELYGELDELTSAASKRHMAGCARCASLLGGLKATRRVAVLPILETPPGLEEKILEAGAEARKLVPFRGRLARAVSLAGSWAMKPQTAMAAVFLLMIGSGLALFGGPKLSKSGDQASMTITQEGAPAALASAAPAGQTEADPMDLAAAANAHGPLAQDNRAPAPVATATAVPPDLQAVAQGDLPGSPNDGIAQRAGSAKSSAYGGGLDLGSSGGGGGMTGGAASAAPMAAASATAAEATSTADFATATAAYRAKNYDEATRDFDALAAAGDDNAALWAARSVRDGNGCSTAVNRFDQLAGRAYGTPPGYDATFEAGQCYKSMGSFDAARQRFARLLTVPSHAARAQAELNKMAPSSAAHQSVKAPAPRAIMPAPANAQQQNAF
jgi:hypothetical protein